MVGCTFGALTGQTMSCESQRGPLGGSELRLLTFVCVIICFPTLRTQQRWATA
jgi:hypothetical protein